MKQVVQSQHIPGVKHIIAVSSAKGGVGKSTTAANLATALSALGKRVGLLDADIYGPSQPTMLGARSKPESINNKLTPVVCHGIQTMSIGYLLSDDKTPMAWRGPMATGALLHFLNDTLWDDVDVLLIDMPPGTGDIALTMAQKMPLTGAVIVTTPQDIALLDAQKGIGLFNKVNIPVLGIIENMSYYRCSGCGQHDAIFSSDGAQKLAEAFKLQLLGQVPLQREIREHMDKGTPAEIVNPESELAELYRTMAERLLAAVKQSPTAHKHKFPKIVVETH